MVPQFLNTAARIGEIPVSQLLSLSHILCGHAGGARLAAPRRYSGQSGSFVGLALPLLLLGGGALSFTGGSGSGQVVEYPFDLGNKTLSIRVEALERDA